MRLLFSSIVIVFAFSSCSLDQCDQTITYTKMTALYGNLEELRIDDIVRPSKAIQRPGKIYVSEDLLIIGDSGSGIHIIDNSVPANPQPLHFLEVPGSTQLYVDGRYIYTNAYYDMLKIDISDLNAINIVKRMEEAFDVRYFNFSDESLIGFNTEIVTEEIGCDDNVWDGGTFFFDFEGTLLDNSAIPTSFISNGSTIGTANRMAISGNDLFVINSSALFSFDITDDELRTHEAYGRDNQIGWSMETIYSKDDLLFIGSQNGMEIYRKTANSIEPVGGYFHATGCDPVLPTDAGIAYITLRSGDECPGDVNTLNVVNINNLNNPFLIQEIQMVQPFGMALINDLLYVGEGNNGLRVFDATNRDMLSEVSYMPSISAYDIIEHPTIPNVILLASETGLVQYDIVGDNYSPISEILF